MFCFLSCTARFLYFYSSSLLLFTLLCSFSNITYFILSSLLSPLSSQHSSLFTHHTSHITYPTSHITHHTSQPVTSRPISGERFLVALDFKRISEEERQVIEDKLWAVCGVIKKWEDDIVENKKKEVEKESHQRKEKLNESGNGIEKRNVDVMKKDEKDTLQGNTVKENEGMAIEVRKDQISKSVGEGEKEVDVEEVGEAGGEVEGEEVEERGFGSYWPFLCSQRECDRASDYLSAINNSHIITQLISNLKILQLAEERGLQISDRDLIAEIGNVEIPRIGKHEDGLCYSDDDDYDDDDQYYSDDDYDDDERGDDEDNGKNHSNSGGNKNSDRGNDRGSGRVNESAEAGKSDFVPGNQVDFQEQERDKEEKGKGDKDEGDKGEGEEEEGDKEKKETEVKEMEEEISNSDGDEDEDEDEDDEYKYEYDYDDDDRDSDRRRQSNQSRSKKRKSRRRTANNKKRRMKKRVTYADAEHLENRGSREEVVDESREEVEDEGMVRTRVTFNIDSRHQVHDPLLAQSQSQIITGEENHFKILDKSDEDDGMNSKTAITYSKNENMNDPAAARTYIRDIVSTDEKKKSIRVHEYYKLWRIYDLDVVY